MAKMSQSKPRDSNVTITTGRNGGKQFKRVTRTKRGMKREIYDYPPKQRKN